MAETLRIPTNLHVKGRLSCEEFACPSGAIDEDALAGSAKLPAAKLVHQFPVDRQLFAPGTTVTALTQLLRTVYGAVGVALSFKAVCTTAPTGDYAITVDLQRSRAGAAFASMLTTPLELSVAESTADRVPQEAVLAATDLEDDDVLQVVVAVSGTTGAQGAGLLVTLFQTEEAA